MSEDDQASGDAYTEGFPPGWLVRQHVKHGPDADSVRWTATRGVKPCVWSDLPLRLGLRSTLIDHRLDPLRAEAWRQEWLGVVYVVTLALTRSAVLHEQPDRKEVT